MSESAFTEIAIKGKATRVSSASINGRVTFIRGKWIRTAVVMDEDMIEGEVVPEPASFLDQLQRSGLRADIFTFAQTYPDVVPKHKFHLEFDNLAVIPISTYGSWWEGRTEAVKRSVKKARKLGVVVQEAEFNDDFVKGISGIYNETPVRQGKPFWHYQDDFETVKKQNSTFPGRSTYIGAYYDGELIGYSWLVHVGKAAHMIQIITQMKHYDKRPSNALIAKAVEICEQKGLAYLVYGNYVYNDPTSSLTEFKRRNGFEKVLVPRYYVPLTMKGNVALTLGLHHGLMGLLPQPVKTGLLRLRTFVFERIVAPMNALVGKGTAHQSNES